MRFLGSKFTQNALAAGVGWGLRLGPRGGSIKRSPRPPSDFRGRFAAGEREGRGNREKEGRGKRNRGIGKG